MSPDSSTVPSLFVMVSVPLARHSVVVLICCGTIHVADLDDVGPRDVELDRCVIVVKNVRTGLRVFLLRLLVVIRGGLNLGLSAVIEDDFAGLVHNAKDRDPGESELL